MLRYSLVFFVLLLLCLPVLPQETDLILPYVYVLERETGYDSFVMDMISGEILHEIADSCPHEMSPNRQWFTYSQMLTNELFAFDVMTGESLPVAESGYVVAWSEDNTRFVYKIFEDDEEFSYIYDLTSESSALVYTGDILAMRFLGNSFFFITIENDLFQLYRWDEETDLIDSFEQPETDERMSLNDVSISPNRQFIALGYQDFNRVPAHYSSYLINAATGEGDSFRESNGLVAFWRPQSPATFAYSEGRLVYLYDALRQEEVILDFYGDDLNWSADGEYFLARNFEEDTTEMRLVQPETGKVIELGTYPRNAGVYFEWVSSSQFVYLIPHEDHRQHEIFLYDVNTHEARQLTDTPEIDEMTGCPLG